MMGRLILVVPLLLLVACGSSDGSPTTGDLVVIVSTTGPEPDADGYTVNVEGSASASAAVQDTLTFPALEPGDHIVTPSGVAVNCAGSSGATATIPAGGADTVWFFFDCQATTGSLAIRMVTNGVALDPDGYQISIDGGTPFAAPINAPTTARVLAVGYHWIAISGVVMNCAANGPGPINVNIEPAEADTLWWAVDCEWPRVAVQINGIKLINPDGTNEQSLLVQTFGNGYANPAWSYDRSMIAVDFQSNGGIGARGVGVLPVDSTTVSPVVKDSLTTKLPRWSPDGSSLIMVRPDSATGTGRLYSAAVVGGPITLLTPDSLYVLGGDWSSDGSEIVFAAQGSDLKTRLYVIQSNGSSIVRITPDSLDQVGSPRWSPAGDRIAFLDHTSLWTITPAGTSATKISIAGYVPASSAAWSPLGDEFLMTGFDPVSGGGALLRISTSGAIHATLTRATGAYLTPDWR